MLTLENRERARLQSAIATTFVTSTVILSKRKNPFPYSF
jgi:hypothetical protein